MFTWSPSSIDRDPSNYYWQETHENGRRSNMRPYIKHRNGQKEQTNDWGAWGRAPTRARGNFGERRNSWWWGGTASCRDPGLRNTEHGTQPFISVVPDVHADRLFYTTSQSRRHGEALVGLAPPNKLPQIEIWNTLQQWSFCQILKCQAPLFKTFWRRFCYSWSKTM